MSAVDLIPARLAPSLDMHIEAMCALIAAERPVDAGPVDPRDYSAAASVVVQSLALRLAQRLGVVEPVALCAFGEATGALAAQIQARTPGWNWRHALGLSADGAALEHGFPSLHARVILIPRAGRPS